MLHCVHSFALRPLNSVWSVRATAESLSLWRDSRRSSYFAASTTLPPVLWIECCPSQLMALRYLYGFSPHLLILWMECGFATHVTSVYQWLRMHFCFAAFMASPSILWKRCGTSQDLLLRCLYDLVFYSLNGVWRFAAHVASLPLWLRLPDGMWCFVASVPMLLLWLICLRGFALFPMDGVWRLSGPVTFETSLTFFASVASPPHTHGVWRSAHHVTLRSLWRRPSSFGWGTAARSYC